MTEISALSGFHRQAFARETPSVKRWPVNRFAIGAVVEPASAVFCAKTR